MSVYRGHNLNLQIKQAASLKTEIESLVNKTNNPDTTTGPLLEAYVKQIGDIFSKAYTI